MKDLVVSELKKSCKIFDLSEEDKNKFKSAWQFLGEIKKYKKIDKDLIAKIMEKIKTCVDHLFLKYSLIEEKSNGKEISDTNNSLINYNKINSLTKKENDDVLQLKKICQLWKTIEDFNNSLNTFIILTGKENFIESNGNFVVLIQKIIEEFKKLIETKNKTNI
jgi:hypothetical protein